MFIKEQRRRYTTKSLLTTILVVLAFTLVYVTTFKYRKSNSIHVELTSKHSSRYHSKNENSRKVQEIQHLIEKTEKLSLDLSHEFNQDLKKMKGFIPSVRKIEHADYLYRYSKNIGQQICNKPYRLLILCLDETDANTRKSYRQSWAREKKDILTSDGVMPIEWKIVFVTDVKSTVQGKLAFEAERKEHNDLIGFTGVHHTRKQSLKLMSALEWVDEYCDFSFLVKMQNGTFLNTPKMFSFLQDPRVPATELYGGVVTYEKNNTVEFYTNNKRLVKGYPRFIKDAFVMSFDVVNKIISKFHWLKPHTEVDAYVGELVLQSGIDVWPVPNFLFHDAGKCESHNLDGILIISKRKCMKIFDDASRRIIPEI